MTDTSFWLFDWLDAYDIHDIDAAAVALEDDNVLDSLREFAVRAKAKGMSAPASEFSLVAGRGLDLSGHLDCHAPACRARQVDSVFRHAWHYFDQIVVADAVSHEVTMHWDAPAADRRKWVLSHIDVLLRVRKLGVEHLLVFREKPPPCEIHWQQHAAEAGLMTIVHAIPTLRRILLQRGRVEFKDESCQSVGFVFIHPEFEHYVWGKFDRDTAPDQSPGGFREAAVDAVIRRYLAHLTSDVAASKQARVPLGASVWCHSQMLNEASRTASTEEVAFHVNMPVLNNVPIDTLVKIRSDQHEAFVRFRYALRRAIAERARTAGDDRAADLAAEIRRDLIDPEIEQIRQRLRSSEQMLVRKTEVGVTLGGLVTVCGLLAGVDPSLATAAGIGTLTTVAGAAAARDIEERRDVSLSDMYFLWKAVEHVSHKDA